MGIGGHLGLWKGSGETHLRHAYTGVTELSTTGWVSIHTRHWVLDCLHHGRQAQRIANGRKFTRLSNIIALYQPNIEFHEYRRKGRRLDEAYIIFDLTGATARNFRAIVSPLGYCHIQDPDRLIADHLQRLGKLLFHRRPGFEWHAQGAFLELIGLVLHSAPLGAQVRRLRSEQELKRSTLTEAVESYIRSRITESFRIRQLAKHFHMSESAFAHTYAHLNGESPYHTVLRLKMEAAKSLLLQEGLGIKSIADRLGFSSEFHFSRIFKRMEGIAPSPYRKNLTK